MAATTDSSRYIVDDTGNRIAVIVDLDQYQRLLEDAEELEDIRAYDEAKASGDEVIPFQQAIDEIEESRK